MKLQGKTYKAVLILIALVCLLGTFLNQRNMNTFRRENQLTHTEQIDNMPPTLAFTTVVLGGFRGSSQTYYGCDDADAGRRQIF